MMPLDISPFTDEQWWSICDAQMSLPVPLAKADVSRPFVYERRFGLFYVPFGHHYQAMTLLLAFQHGFTKGFEVTEHFQLASPWAAADMWLEKTDGACFKSSVSNMIQAGKKGSLSMIERRILGHNISYLF